MGGVFCAVGEFRKMRPNLKAANTSGFVPATSAHTLPAVYRLLHRPAVPKRSGIRAMQSHAQQHTMHPDAYPNPSPRPRPPGQVPSLSMPVPRHIRALSFAVPTATGWGGNGGGGRARGEIGEMVAGDVRYAHVDAGSRSQQEQVCVGACLWESESCRDHTTIPP